MPKLKKKPKQVMIVVKPAKRGYIVQAAGTDNLYPCMDAESMGEAIIEILEDPDQPSMEFDEPEAPRKRSSKRSASAADEEEEEDEGYEEQPRSAPSQPRPEGWSAGDEVLIGVLGSAAERLRNFSNWRGK